MSVVVARVYEDKIEMAADSICVRGWSRVDGDMKNCVKMLKHNNMILGGCGYAEETSIFFHYIKTHTIEVMDEKGVLDFVIEFKRWKKDFIGCDDFENSYLIAYKGKCFYIKSMFVHEISDSCAIGAGEDYARGALYMGATPAEAVKAACALCVYVSEPIMVESIPKCKENELSQQGECASENSKGKI